jgi:two-component sensor histidine kinase
VFPLGLIITELCTNTMKHAFGGVKGGEIHLLLKKTPEGLLFEMGDSGQGLPEGFDMSKASGFGLRLVDMLATQLGGSMQVQSGRGTRYRLSFSEK